MTNTGSIFELGWVRRSKELGRQDWLAIAEMVLHGLEAALRRKLQFDGQDVGAVDEGFCLEARSTDRDETSLDLRVRAIVGTDIIDDRLLIRASVFLYTGIEQLRSSGEYLEMQYVPGDGGRWTPVAWRTGEPGEFDDFATFE